MKNVIIIVRWIAFLPLAFVAMLLAYAAIPVFNLIQTMSYIDLEWPPVKFINFIGYNIFQGMAFMYTAWYVAPSNKKIASYVSFVAFTILFTVAIIGLLISRSFSQIAASALIFLGGILALIGILSSKMSETQN